MSKGKENAGYTRDTVRLNPADLERIHNEQVRKSDTKPRGLRRVASLVGLDIRQTLDKGMRKFGL